jgi:hypothetical protein
MTITATVYVDSQDSEDTGWAWRVVTLDEDGRHEESGAADDELDGVMQAAAQAEGVIPTELSGWDCVDGGGERHYLFAV